MIKRYSHPEMRGIWDEKNRFDKMLQIEIQVCEAWCKLGRIPKRALSEIKKKARVDLKKINDLEKKTQHEVVAFINSVSSFVGKNGKYIHLGVTSSDILDTTLALQLKQASDIIIKDLETFSKVIKKKANSYKYTLMIGRTHGIHAEPITLGWKFALWYTETLRNIERIKQAKEIISVGKISGAVGTYAHLTPEIEKQVLRKLGLKPALVSTQIIQRDRHAQYLCALAIIASSFEKFATEIRHLQRTEIREMEEYFSSTQKGSSAMPHKRNPVLCERICGLARLVRGFAFSSLENINLWNERDISHSSVERVIFPDTTILLDYMIRKFIQIMSELFIYPENMLKNIDLTKGAIFSQGVLLRLIEKGLSREDAYNIIQRISQKAFLKKQDLLSLLEKDAQIKKYLTLSEIKECFDLNFYIRYVDKVFKRLNKETRIS